MEVNQNPSAKKSNLDLSTQEIVLLKSVLNEICNGPDAIEEWEFQTRTGFSKQEAELLLERLEQAV